MFLAVSRRRTLPGQPNSRNEPSDLAPKMEALELAVGQTLFIRGPRGYELTPDGEILFQEALEVEDAVYRTQRSLKDRNTAFDGEVRITLPEDLVHFVTPTLETSVRNMLGYEQRCSSPQSSLMSGEIPILRLDLEIEHLQRISYSD